MTMMLALAAAAAQPKAMPQPGVRTNVAAGVEKPAQPLPTDIRRATIFVMTSPDAGASMNVWVFSG